MGTSTSHPSPESLRWRAAQTGYVASQIPIERVVNEIWRAGLSQPQSIEKLLGSSLVFQCQVAMRDATSKEEALRVVTEALSASKANSIVSELARRAIVPAFRSDQPASEWRASLFEQVTDYFISRDISGFVGEKFRNKTVRDVIRFKEDARAHVRDKVRTISLDPGSPKVWRRYVRRAVSLLAGR